MTSKLAKITLTLALLAFLPLSTGCDERGYGSYTDSFFSFDVFDSFGSYFGGGDYYDEYYEDDYYYDDYYDDDYYDDYYDDDYYDDDWWKKK
jgi:hypothetical protein